MTGAWLISYILLWVLLLSVAAILISSLRNLGIVYSMIIKSPGFARSSESRSNLKQGDALPDLRLQTGQKEQVQVSAFRGTKTAFAVVSANCEACWIFLRSSRDDGPDPLDPDLHNIVLISLSDPEATVDLLTRAEWEDETNVLFDSGGAIARHWGITVTPAMVIVDEAMLVVRQVFGAIATPDGHDRPTESPRVAETDRSNRLATEVRYGK